MNSFSHVKQRDLGSAVSVNIHGVDAIFMEVRGCFTLSNHLDLLKSISPMPWPTDLQLGAFLLLHPLCDYLGKLMKYLGSGTQKWVCFGYRAFLVQPLGKCLSSQHRGRMLQLQGCLPSHGYEQLWAPWP